MKKRTYIIIAVIITLLIIAGCIYAYIYFTNEIKNTDDGLDKDKGQNNEVISNEALYTLENFPRVDASTATQPLVIAQMKNLTGSEIDVNKMNFTKTHQAYERLIKNEVDLIVVTQPSKEELELAKVAGIELEVIPVVREGFVFFTNSKNKVNNLTTEQVQKIYTGEITNWSQVGGENMHITPYQRPNNSGSQTGMLSLVMKDKKLMEPLKENLVGTMEEIVNLVSVYDNSKVAIGYSYYYYATTMYEDIDKEVTQRIKFFNVDGVTPNEDTIKSGKYPFTTSYYIVINKASDENSAARKLANVLLSARGQKVAKEAGYVPVK